MNEYLKSCENDTKVSVSVLALNKLLKIANEYYKDGSISTALNSMSSEDVRKLEDASERKHCDSKSGCYLKQGDAALTDDSRKLCIGCGKNKMFLERIK